MSQVILLDSGPLGLVTNPRANPDALACKNWLQDKIRTGDTIVVPEVTDYEVRRELLRSGKSEGLRNLDVLKSISYYLPITTRSMLQAAQFWAVARNQGIATADRFALDADAILAAQAATLDPSQFQMSGGLVIVATMNVAHLNRFVPAQDWRTL